MKRSKPLRRTTGLRRGPPKKRKTNVAGIVSQSEYEAMKKVMRARAGHRCEGCGSSQYRLTPHHRKLQSQGGEDRLANLLCLCVLCHDWSHLHPLAAQQRGWIVPSYADPEARGAWLHDGSLVLLDDEGNYAQTVKEWTA